MTKNDFLMDLENTKAFAKILEGWIIGKSNSVINKLGLIDLKLKEQKIHQEQISQVKAHPGDLNSNAGNNIIWKERLEDVINNVASVHSEFDINLNGICDVIKKVDNFIDIVSQHVDAFYFSVRFFIKYLER